MNKLERGAVTFMGCLFFLYVSISFIAWDIAWVTEINTVIDRLGLLILLSFSFYMGHLVYSFTEDD